MATLAITFCVISPWSFQLQFRVRSITWIPFGIDHETSQLCRTGHDDVSLTRMTTLIFILSLVISPWWFQMQFCVCSVTWKPFGKIVMILHIYVEQVMMMCRVQEWQLSFLYFLSYLPLIVKATMPSILNTIRNIQIWILCQNSLTRELKIRF